MEHKRKSVRLRKWNYSWGGYYFVTICTGKRREILGEIVDKKMVLNDFGCIVCKWIGRLDMRFQIEVDEWVIMPNHVHMVLNVGAHHDAPNEKRAIHESPVQRGNKRSLLSKIVGYLKANVSKEICQPIWQRNYYEHIVRNETEYKMILEYIRNNPEKWQRDRNNPINITKTPG